MAKLSKKGIRWRRSEMAHTSNQSTNSATNWGLIVASASNTPAALK